MKRSADVNEEPHPGKPLFHRREFLAFGSAGLLAPLFKDFAWAEPLAAEAAVRPMSVGYIDGSETFRNLRRLPRQIRRPGLKMEGERVVESSPVIVPATDLFQGDTSLPGRPLRIRIDGLYPPLALEPKRRRELPLAADLDVFFPSPDPAIESPVLFMAWSFRRRPGWNPSPPVSFRFPLDWQALPMFTLRVQWAPDTPPLVLRAKFTLDDESGRPRLRRGVYLLGLAPGAWDREVELTKFGRRAPAELSSVLISMDPEEEA